MSDLPARPPLYISQWLTIDQAKDRLMALGFSAEDAKTQITDIVRDGMSGDGPVRIRVNGKPPSHDWLLILRHHPPALWGSPGCVVEIHREDSERLLGPETGPPAPDSRPESPEPGCGGQDSPGARGE